MSEETIFQEVSEELRSERMRNLWRRYGPWIIGVAVLIVVGVAANEGWQWYKNSVAAASSDKFYSAIQALDDGDIADAQSRLNETIADGVDGYPDLARFAQAAILAEQGERKAALAAYDSLSTTLSDPDLRDLAALQAVSLMVDDGDVGAVEARLTALLAPDNGLHNVARELLALTQYAAGDKQAAHQTFSQIKADPLAGQNQLQRIELFDAQLTAEGVVEETDAPSADTSANSADVAANPGETPADNAAAASDAAN
ncbi:MAG: tetratricopeptide repeat protein [Hyphomicrobiaceae bacterium]|nr:tetratricopeptide repeat protein [Hyphomicrobiaceae bacterium]MCC0024667.1 tetratricopeptide repeat protein [Hyphomicrobiaceae bacterium]